MNTNIRNFCIIAHIDHGKSTLADRLLEATGTIEQRKMQEQVLDSNPIERERGITIKLAPVRMKYKPSWLFFERGEAESRSYIKESSRLRSNNNEFILNLIDTPGHVDFNYEVSRSLQACEGAILVVDATRGVQAQTLANLNLARKQKLVIIPVINKIDLPNAQVDRSIEELISLSFRKEDIITISAKVGTNIDQVLKAIIEKIPPPRGIGEKPLRALVFSSQYDIHKGVVVFVRIVDGDIRRQLSASGSESLLARRVVSRQTRLKFMASGVEFEPLEVGYFNPEMKASESLLNGEVGYIATGLKDAGLAKVGDTITTIYSSSESRRSGTSREVTDNKESSRQARTIITPLPGYQEPKPMVFLGLYPINSDEYSQVRDAMGKLRLSDSAFTYRPISSQALGHGFHCGFLGLLHAEVVQERLTREFNLNLLATAPTVEYRVKVKSDKQQVTSNLSDLLHVTSHVSPKYLTIQSASEFPDPSLTEQSLEPLMQVTIFAPKDFTGVIMQLCQNKRGEYIELAYVGEQIKLIYLMPLSEMIIDFFDKLKSVTAGYASLDYEFFDHQEAKIVKMDILLNHEKVDAFSQLVVEERALYLGKMMVEKLKDVIPRHQFSIPVQAAIGGTIIARSDVKPFRKDVTQKLYGGDRTRKDKLLEAQRKGKARMKKVGKVEIPQSTFLQVFKRG